jgi:orotate phosphoribosyltransferase-like protein
MTLSQDEIRQIIQMRGLGYTQQEIADRLGISRKTVENHLSRLRLQAEEAEEENDLDELFWGIILGAGALALLGALLGSKQKGGGNK